MKWATTVQCTMSCTLMPLATEYVLSCIVRSVSHFAFLENERMSPCKSVQYCASVLLEDGRLLVSQTFFEDQDKSAGGLPERVVLVTLRLHCCACLLWYHRKFTLTEAPTNYFKHTHATVIPKSELQQPMRTPESKLTRSKVHITAKKEIRNKERGGSRCQGKRTQ